MITPVLLLTTASFVPPILDAIEGIPKKAASKYDMPKPSTDQSLGSYEVGMTMRFVFLNK